MGTLAEGIELHGWEPSPKQSADENGLDLALIAARSSKCKDGSMGCALVSPSGDILAVQSNGPLWGPVNARRPASDLHAEVRALGACARRGVATEGAMAYVSMVPCTRCFSVVVTCGVHRMVTRKPMLSQDEKKIG